MSFRRDELLDYWFADDDYRKIKPVDPDWIFLPDGDFYQIHSSVVDLLESDGPKDKPIKKVYTKRKPRVVNEDPPPSKKPRPYYALQATLTDHYVRNPSQAIRKIRHSVEDVCQGEIQIPKKVHMKLQDRLQAGIFDLQQIHNTVGKVVKVKIGHDNGCPTFDERECTCCPDIDLMVDDSIYSIDSNGLIKIIGHGHS